MTNDEADRTEEPTTMPARRDPDEPMKTYSFAMRPSDYNRIRDLIESTGDIMSAFIRRSMFRAAREIRKDWD